MENALRKIFTDYTNHQNFSGVCLAKKADEIIFERASGYANRAFKIPNRMDTKFDSASITKTFTAVAVLQLVQQGLLKIEDFIVNIVNLEGTKIPKNVKIHHLLNHTSGIADDADEEAGEHYSALFVDRPNYAIRECKDFLKNFAYKEPNFEAGTHVRYNNCAFVLLGLAMEKKTGIDYRSYVVKNIFEKAGMTNTKFCAMDGINENTAEGYVSIWKEVHKNKWEHIGYKKNIYSYPPIGSPDGGAYTTVEDLYKFLRAIKDKKLLNEEYSQMILSPHCEFTRPSLWKGAAKTVVRTGYAFEFLEIEEEPFCIFKEGSNDGVAAMFSYYPKSDITLSILANQDCNVWEMHRMMQTEIYKGYY